MPDDFSARPLPKPSGSEWRHSFAWWKCILSFVSTRPDFSYRYKFAYFDMPAWSRVHILWIDTVVLGLLQEESRSRSYEDQAPSNFAFPIAAAGPPGVRVLRRFRRNKDRGPCSVCIKKCPTITPAHTIRSDGARVQTFQFLVCTHTCSDRGSTSEPVKQRTARTRDSHPRWSHISQC
jgi:hypothetical protein